MNKYMFKVRKISKKKNKKLSFKLKKKNYTLILILYKILFYHCFSTIEFKFIKLKYEKQRTNFLNNKFAKY